MSQNATLTENKQSVLKDTVISQAPEKSHSSPLFEELEAIVKQFLERQDTDSALKHLTIGARRLGSSDVHYDI